MSEAASAEDRFGPSSEIWKKAADALAAKEFATAMAIYQEGAAAGNARAMRNLGKMYAAGNGVTLDEARAIELYKRAVDGGDAKAMLIIGNRHRQGRGVMEDLSMATNLYRRAAALGNAAAMFQLGYAYEEGLLPDPLLTGARTWYERGAQAGNKDCMYWLGMIFEYGRGVPIDTEAAMHWYRKAADAGYAPGWVAMGDIAKRIDANPARAMEYFRKAAAAGSGFGKLRVGQLLMSGWAAKDFTQEAMKLFHEAAESGEIEAMCELARAYETGNGLPRDLVRAKEWYEKAAALGSSRGTNALKSFE